MLKETLKNKLIQFIQFNFQPRIEALHSETIFQGLFNQQCLNYRILNDFYPVGAAASYSLMYLLVRIVKELPIEKIIELGSGQTTVLIDRIKTELCSHTAYEQNSIWANILRERLSSCNYRERPLIPKQDHGVTYEGYENLDIQPFDLLLVDGPNGTDNFSRFTCIPLIEANLGNEFIIIIDDASRAGEQETILYLTNYLSQKKVDFKLNYISGRTSQAVITTPKYRAASYFF
jgi:hypothetical protein